MGYNSKFCKFKINYKLNCSFWVNALLMCNRNEWFELIFAKWQKYMSTSISQACHATSGGLILYVCRSSPPRRLPNWPPYTQCRSKSKGKHFLFSAIFQTRKTPQGLVWFKGGLLEELTWVMARKEVILLYVAKSGGDSIAILLSTCCSTQ